MLAVRYADRNKIASEMDPGIIYDALAREKRCWRGYSSRLAAGVHLSD